MGQGAYREDLLELCQRRFWGDPDIEPAKMMGHPGFKTAHNNKFFLFCFEDGLVLKMPPELYEEALRCEDTFPFQPTEGHKPMSTWIVWTCPEAEDYSQRWQWVLSAREYTASEPPNKKRKKRWER